MAARGGGPGTVARGGGPGTAARAGGPGMAARDGVPGTLSLLTLFSFIIYWSVKDYLSMIYGKRTLIVSSLSSVQCLSIQESMRKAFGYLITSEDYQCTIYKFKRFRLLLCLLNIKTQNDIFEPFDLISVIIIPYLILKI